ncbi:MAG: AAA family ATPase [Desulfovibrio sp.]|uniref:AAA family ATPase n=1 Tax=Desulfovibrio sp. TaxID=885 RepID=UPI0039E30D32
MHIKSIKLKNFRCFERLSLTLHERLNVFFGENGSGKSSIFEAINILLGNIIDKLGSNTAVKTGISYEDVHNESFDSHIEISLCDKKLITWGIRAEKTITKGDFSTHNQLDCAELESYVKNIINMILLNKKPKLPIFLSYKSTRYTEYFYPKGEETYILSPKACYDDAISMNFDYNKFFKWFKAREDLELQKSKEDISYSDKELQSVKNAIKAFYNFSNFSFDRETWQFFIEKSNHRVFYKQLSDGERGYILLIGDIARRLAIANPALEDPLGGEGIILIDEIELHLHPKWQRTIIPGLLKTFPNCQFLIASHSPQVLGEVQKESVWIIEEGEKPYHPPRSFGMESSELLRELMGAESRNSEVTEALENIDRLLDEEKLTDADNAIKTLAQKTGKIPEVISANSQLAMMRQAAAKVTE